MKERHIQALQSASTELSEKALANYPSEVAGWETRQQLCQTLLKQDLRLTASGQSRRAALTATVPLALVQEGLGKPKHGGMSPRGQQQLDIAVTGTLERCWGLLLVQAGLSVSRRKKSPRVSLKLILLLMPPQKQDPAVLCVPTEIIAFPDHFFLD